MKKIIVAFLGLLGLMGNKSLGMEGFPKRVCIAKSKSELIDKAQQPKNLQDIIFEKILILDPVKYNQTFALLQLDLQEALQNYVNKTYPLEECPFVTHEVKTLDEFKKDVNRRINRGVEVNRFDFELNSPLNYCIGQKKFEHAFFLVQIPGIDLETSNRFQVSPLLNAIKAQHLELSRTILNQLISQNKKETLEKDDRNDIFPLLAACLYLPLFIKDLLNEGAQVNRYCTYPDAWNMRRPLLHMAIISKPEIVPLLLTPQINLETRDSVGWTSLMVALKYNLEVAEILIDHGADVRAIDLASRYTPLFIARQNPSHTPDIINKLIAKGATH